MQVINSMRKSWDVKPFVDVRVIDTTTEGSYCPSTHPDDIIHEIWLGTRGLCDCLEREGGRSVKLDTMCVGHGDDADHGPDCHDVAALAPRVQNQV